MSVKKYDGWSTDAMMGRVLALEDEVTDLKADRHSLESEIAVLKAENQEYQRRLKEWSV